NEIIEIFTRNYRNCSRHGATPTKPIIYLGDLEKLLEGQEVGRAGTEERFFVLSRYLQNQKIITYSCTIKPFLELRCHQYQFTLHEEFIKKLNTDLR
ncbi:MAG TPA: hypothetical protein VFU89_08245, partial [Rhabdochlamydiaceae bacterium]|nr:hypothetical protein [Rhabdochlamydiaceae bacterium]